MPPRAHCANSPVGLEKNPTRDSSLPFIDFVTKVHMPFLPTAAAGAGLTWKHGMAAILAGNMLRRSMYGRIGSKSKKIAKKGSQLGSGKANALAAALRRKQNTGWHNLERLSFFPDSKMADFTYVKSGSVSTSVTPFTTGAAEGIFRLNSCFDPDASGGGTQPYQWDQVTPLYNKYKVFSVTIKLTWLSNVTDEIMIGCSIILPSVDAFSLVTKVASNIDEKRGGDTRRLAPNGEMRFEVFSRIRIKDLEGAGGEFNSDQYSAATNTDPVRQPLLKIAAASMTSTAAVALHFNLEITYRTKMYDRVTVARS